MPEPTRRRPIPAWRRLYENGSVRKTLLLVVLALVWEGYARVLNNPLLFPTLTATVAALSASIAIGRAAARDRLHAEAAARRATCSGWCSRRC